jgi:hypothetical protein
MRKMRTKVAKVLRSTHPKPDRKTAGSAQGGGCGGTTWPRTDAGRAKTAINTRRHLNHLYIEGKKLETFINFPTQQVLPPFSSFQYRATSSMLKVMV